MSEKEVSRLKDLDVLEVSLVPKGANKRKFLLLKSDQNLEGDESMKEVIEQILKSELQEEDKITEELQKANLSEKAVSAAKGALRILSAFKKEFPKDFIGTLSKLSGYDLPAQKEEEKAKKKEEDPKPAIKEDGTPVYELIPDKLKPMVEKLCKSQEDAVKKSNELEKILKEEREKRLIKEFIAKASEFKKLPINAEEFGLVMKEFSERAPEAYEKLESILKATDKAIEDGNLFKSMGTDQTPEDNIMSKVEKAASEKMKANDKLTKEQAITEVLKENPELYEKYESEKSAN